ncbi:hypothetical protein DIPPA_02028 [Diplonema papillatum]|nr:hypothetical protein DIPPA_02028 [Diplonema papillatum]
MRASFGRHPQGFFAMVEILRDWIHTIPLTGERAGDNTTPAGPDTGGLRVGFIQFSGQNPNSRGQGGNSVAIETSGNTGTGGRLSGDVGELDEDLDWHEKKYIGKGTMIRLALEMAGDMFDKLHVTSQRQRVLFIFTDGQIYDPQELAPARAVLDNEEVETFGIVIRRQQSHTAADLDAEETLYPITSDPHDTHFQNIQVDEVDKAVLHDMCDPNGIFGSLILSKTNAPGQAGLHQPCPIYRDATGCSQDPGCMWSAANRACVDSPCVKICDEPACTAATVYLCVWSSTTGCLKETQCAYTDKQSCQSSSQQCVWNSQNTCGPPICVANKVERDCLADLEDCTWTTINGADQCMVTPCRAGSAADCQKDPLCVWEVDACDGTTAKCKKAGCTAYQSDFDCTSDPRCAWLGNMCDMKECTQYTNDACCDKQTGCKWSIATTPATCQQKECYAIQSQQKCDDNPNCMFDNKANPAGCVDLDCTKYPDKCACNQNDKCYYKDNASPKQCVSEFYGMCPTTDIVVVFGGTASMGESFARHPIGYYALVEMLRDWVTALPLSQEPASTGTGSQANSETVRVGLVQFAGGATAGTATGGRLSGQAGQLTGDLDWHEANFAAGDALIQSGLERATGIFQSDSPSDGREKVLIVITDSKIQDTDKVKAAIDTLDNIGVQRFGIVVRKLDSQTKVDADAEASLKPMTSDLQNDHFVNIELDGLPDHLAGICDPNAKWGSQIVTNPPGTSTGVHLPCTAYKQESACASDVGCVWSDTAGVCSNSPCLEICDEADCNNNPSKDCVWTGGSCQNVPPTPTCPCKVTSQQQCDSDPQCTWTGSVCEIDECKHGSAGHTACVNNGQRCVDNDKAPCTNDWFCECLPPATSAPNSQPSQGAADCIIDECVADCPTCEDDLCETENQDCNDPDKSVSALSNWVCTCRAPYKGSAVTNTAICQIDECVEDCPTCSKGTCVSKNQTCNDPDFTTLSNWRCTCPPPSSNSALISAVASCDETECVRHNATCVDAGQSCNDPDPRQPDDWECVCIPPMTGSATMGMAKCLINECEEVCPTCEDDLCPKGSPAQTCNDPDHSANSLSDWTCTCPPPVPTSAVASLAACPLDECEADCPTCSNGTCKSKNQTCLDPVPTTESLDDWSCYCPPPSSKSLLTAAVPTCEADECEVHNKTCVDADQACIDPNPRQPDDWECVCPPPTTGNKTASVADCLINECVETCPTCEHDLCPNGTQTCFDPDHSVKSLSDWECTCPPPSTNSALTSLADCPLDECVDKLCPTCSKGTCTEKNQTCLDPSPTTFSLSDWTCTCPPPSTQFALISAVPVCDNKECELHEKTCIDADQDCLDPDPTQPDDWQCTCRDPMKGSATGGVANCTLDECVAVCATCEDDLCSKEDQLCEDLDKSSTSLSDWRCICKPPANGSAITAVAHCELDECEVPTCATCEKDLCSNANPAQTCHDPNKTASSTNDWTCTCPPPAVGVKLIAVADCVVDECAIVENEEKCGNASQVCIDPVQTAASLDDWECHCVVPPAIANLSALMKPADCEYGGDCPTDTDAQACVAAGHLCNDPNKAPTSLKDWFCECTPPMKGTPQLTSPTVDCELNECIETCPTCAQTQSSPDNLCELEGQTCLDPDFKTFHDWTCTCPPPATNSAVGALAKDCVANECVLRCATCANETCTSVNQKCHDPNHDVSSLSDWTCTCEPPAVGTATAKQATCLCDECKTTTTCVGANQLCYDKNLTCHDGTAPDYLCECLPPTTGTAVAAVAVCAFNECPENKGTCEVRGQICNDPDNTTLNNWECVCPPPSNGTALMKAAECILDECIVKCDHCSNETCTSVGQKCKDPNTAITSKLDWTCECVDPGVGKATAKAATCYCDECINTLTCDLAGQFCYDKNTTCHDGAPDFLCECPPPSTGTAVGAAAECTQNECLEHEPTCTIRGQKCNDTDVTTLNSWECVCPPPSQGRMMLGAAVCVLDECVETCEHCSNTTCKAVGQTCDDPNNSTRSIRDWICTCTSPGTGHATAKPATCRCDECSYDDTCTKANQTCYDRDVTCHDGTAPDFQCECLQPATGVAIGQAATCMIKECPIYGTECTRVGQVCIDPSDASDDWECHCPNGTVGYGTDGPIGYTKQVEECRMDECAETCQGPTCSNKTCASKNQSCYDPNPEWRSLGDWVCKCPKPSTVQATMKPADCFINECLPNAFKCVIDCQTGSLDCKQTCIDPDMNSTSLGDWMCVCQAPSTDFAVAKAAICTVDPCVHDTESTCLQDSAGCRWSLIPTPTCSEEQCTATKEVECVTDAACEWRSYTPTSAGDVVVYEMQADIQPFAGATCAGMGGCSACSTMQPGAYVAFTSGYVVKRDSLTCSVCASLGVSLAWDEATGVLVLGSATGDVLAQAVAGLTFNTPSSDAAKRSMVWNYGTNPTASDAAGSCTTQAGVDLSLGFCMLEKCKYINETTCEADPFCDWVGGNTEPCVVAPCVEYPTEKECKADLKCRYDVGSSPAVCTPAYCSKFLAAKDCDLDAVCMWNQTDQSCAEKDCSKYDGDRCACEEEQTCFWDATIADGRCVKEQFGTCPVVDVILLLDGSASMSQSFTRHPHGFYAMMEMLRDWMKTLPLTGEKSSVGSASSAANGGIRVGIVQFSGEAPVKDAVRTPPGTGTSGALSGDLQELMDDVTWHENNFLQGGTYMATGLQWAADMFNASPLGRKRALFIITDGKIKDADGMTAARTMLDQESVEVFGVVLRRQITHTTTDTDAETALRPLTSDVHDDHFLNLQIDELPEQVLDGICDPNSVWGAILNPGASASGRAPCSQHVDQSTCSRDPGCVYSSVGLSCVDSACLKHCDELQCDQDTANNCFWNGTAKAEGCYKQTVCPYPDANVCNADQYCEWNSTSSQCEEKECTQPTEAECEADAAGCEWIALNATCAKKPCKYDDEASCAADGDCEWDECSGSDATGGCEVKRCVGSDMQTEAACQADLHCEWSNNACTASACGKHSSGERCCNREENCKWDVSASPALCAIEHCAKLNGQEDPCNSDPGCEFEATSSTCVKRECVGRDACECRGDPECYYNAENAFCTESEYGLCPTMDLVIVVDASASTGQAFGRHPHGFVGIMEVLRDWMRELPLSGEASSVGTAAAAQQRIRAALIQFAGTDAQGTSAGESRATSAPTGTGTGGRLSGVLTELEADIDWHEDNFYSGGTMIKKGIELAVTAFGLSPKDGRKKVLLIIGDGKLVDADSLAPSRAGLEKAGVEVSIFNVLLSNRSLFCEKYSCVVGSVLHET